MVQWVERSALETESVGSNPYHGKVVFSVGIFFSSFILSFFLLTGRTLFLTMLVGTWFIMLCDSSLERQKEELQKKFS